MKNIDIDKGIYDMDVKIISCKKRIKEMWR